MASGIVMYRPASATPSNIAFTNGDLATPNRTIANTSALSSDSESALSDAIDPPASSIKPSFSIEQDNNMTSREERSNAQAYSSEDAIGSDDGDFEFESPPPPPPAARVATSESPAPSEGSSIRGKRKASVEEEDYINGNPELYGLRRSGRARPTRRIVDDDSDEDESDSDIQSRPRKRMKSSSSKPVSKRSSLSQETSPDSDSDIEAYGAPRPRSRGNKKLQQRRLLVDATRDQTPTHSEVRFSTRKAAKATNYNEDDNDPFEEDEDLVSQSYWAAAEDTSPAVDIVLEHRLREGVDTDVTDPTKEDFEYKIKWQGKAHCHSTWETYGALASYRGLRKLDNYFKKVVLTDIEMEHNKDVPLEEKEQWLLDREAITDAQQGHTKIERVIDHQEDEDGDTSYFIKWRGLSYDNCTWESGELVTRQASEQIDHYINRTRSLPVSDRTQANPETRTPHTHLAQQPSYIKHGKLRDFQLHGLNWMAFNWCKANNVILADEMGLGKTVQTIAFMNWLRHERNQQGPFLVIVPLSTMPAWAETFDNWTPDINYVVYNGNEASRKIIREHELLVDGSAKRTKFNVLLTSYEYILVDAPFLSQIKWQFMAIDEAHRLKNRDSQLYGKLQAFKVPARLLITGTPMQNTLGELSALMDFLMPGLIDIDENLDLQSEEAGRKIAELTKEIQPYMLRRTKNKVESEMPQKTEKIIRVELSDTQLELYKNILTRNYAALNQGSKGQKQGLLNIMMELKKASLHPFMFPNTEDRILADVHGREEELKALITNSGKMMLLDQLLMKLKKDGHRVLIFSQMVKMLHILSHYLHLRGYQHQRLDGTVPAGPRANAINHFNAPDSKDYCFLLSTRAGGLGINLMTADTVILFDSDWNPQADLQAMARAHRIGQEKPVTVYRLVSKDTVEEEILERARNKLMLEYITIQRGVTDKDEKKGLEDKIKQFGEEPNSSDDISHILKRRGQKMFEQSGNQKKLEELNIDAVLENAEEHQTEQQEGIAADGGEDFLRSFEYTDVKLDLEWDDIIPKEQLDQIKADEKKKADAKFLQDQIEAAAPRSQKRKKADEDREERAAKKRARTAASSSTPESDQDPGLDPSRPLNEKEVRNLLKAYIRYGSLDERTEELVQEARLVGRDLAVLRSTLDDVKSHAARLLKEEQERIELAERNEGKKVTKKDKKAVLFDYRGTKRNNAETIIERPGDMRMLKEVTDKCSDPKTFRIPEASKGAEYSCEWGAKEDGMLCVGIVRHGYGAWVAIRDDPDLGLADKLFLEEHRVEKKDQRMKGQATNAKSPGAVHLVRRADYLLSVLKAKTSNGTNLVAKRAVENHHRNNKKNGLQAGKTPSRPTSSASPAPSRVEKSRRPEKQHHRHSIERRVSANGARNGLSPRPDSSHRTANGHRHSNSDHRAVKTELKREPSQDHQGNNGSSQTTSMMKLLFKPIKGSLNAVNSATKQQIPDKQDRAKLLRVELVNIGDFIKRMCKDPDGSNLRGTLWDYVSEHWPTKDTQGTQIMDMYDRLVHTQTNGAVHGASNGVAASNDVAPT